MSLTLFCSLLPHITPCLKLRLALTEKILPVVKRQHLLLCTLLICNAAAMEVSERTTFPLSGSIWGMHIIDFLELVDLADTSYISRWLGNSLGCHSYFGDFDPSIWRGQFLMLCVNFTADTRVPRKTIQT